MTRKHLASEVISEVSSLCLRTKALLTDGETIMKFGKYSEKTYTYVHNTDRSYCKWIIKQNVTNYEGLLFKQWVERVNFIMRRN